MILKGAGNAKLVCPIIPLVGKVNKSSAVA